MPIEDPRAAIAAIWINPIPVKGEPGAVIRATITSIAGVGRNGMMFPPMLTKKTSKSGFPLNNDTRESIMGKVDNGEPSGWPSAKQPYLKKPRKKVERLANQVIGTEATAGWIPYNTSPFQGD